MLVQYTPNKKIYTVSAHLPIPISFQISAADHFVCRSSHAVPVHKFCPHLLGEKEDEERRFESLKQATLSQLCTRFRFYYSNPSFLGEMAGPALRELVSEMKGVVQSTSLEPATTNTTKKPFRVYSCHDVTILALLFALRDRYLGSELAEELSQWPTYATCLTLELVRLETPVSTAPPSFVVRVWLNEAPIPTFSPFPIGIRTTRDEEPSFSIHLSKFEEIVNELNTARIEF